MSQRTVAAIPLPCTGSCSSVKTYSTTAVLATIAGSSHDDKELAPRGTP